MKYADPQFIKSSQDDYRKAIAERGVTEEQARAISENVRDQIPFTHSGHKITVAMSRLEGKGIFAVSSISEGEVIAPVRISGMRTPAGRFTNHSISPNAKMVVLPTGEIRLVAISQIDASEEVTVNYRLAREAAIEANRIEGRNQ